MKNPSKVKEGFYKKVLEILTVNKIPFLLGGTFAIREYTGINRLTPDMDIFCKAGVYPGILKVLAADGFKTAVPDARWIAKVSSGHQLVDIIFSTPQGIVPVDDTWFEHPFPAKILGQTVRLVPPEEMIWSKSYRMDRYRFDGPDINHLILKQGLKLDWKKLLTRMEAHWELLFAYIIIFRFTYPSEREIIPNWLIKELTDRFQQQMELPPPDVKVCRGPYLAIDPYKIDLTEWGFKDIL
jgi:hypothetical protein